MTIDDIQKLYYEQKLSASEVGQRLGKTVWQVIAFMKKHKLARRPSSETNHFYYERQELSYKKKIKLTSNEQRLYISGLMLYWGEGAKNTGAVVDLVNSDSTMHKIFISMLRKIYQVREEKFRILLYCFKNQDESELKQFWSKTLNVPTNKFLKSYIRQDFDPTKTHKMPFGVVHLRYYDKKLYTQIQKDTDIIAKDLIVD